MATVLDRGTSGPAVSSGWAAIESMMIGRGEGQNRVNAADRLASIIACSFPRAELTKLAFRHMSNGTDKLAAQLARATTNRERANMVATHLNAGGTLTLPLLTDNAAATRMSKLIKESRKCLDEVRTHVTKALRRFYRQRNLVMHAGKIDTVTLKATLRTAAPLIGAGMDRIAHAVLNEGIDALDLAARANNALGLVESRQGKPVTDLLEP